jgi:hypothetical protein
MTITASVAEANAPFVISGSFPVNPPTKTAMMSMESQIQLSMAAEHADMPHARQGGRQTAAGRRLLR